MMTLRERMKKLRLSVNGLAALTGRSRVTVWRWRKSNRYPRYVLTILKAQESAGRRRPAGRAAPSRVARG
jgi:transcriptional regulator with XRE-family HTH domain